MSSIYTEGYRYLFQQLWVDPASPINPVVGELPLTGVNFTKQINSIGTFQGHLLLSGVNAFELDVHNITTPGKYALYVDYNGTLVWGGVIWGRDYNSADQTLIIHAQEFGSYFDRRRIADTFVFFETNIFYTIENLIKYAQQVEVPTISTPIAGAGNIGLSVTSVGTGSVQKITQTYHTYEFKSILQAITDISRNDVGVDLAWDVYYDFAANLTPARKLTIGNPRIGSEYSPTADPADFPIDTGVNNYVFQFPGNITEYSYIEDGFTGANSVYYLGAGSNEGKLISRATDDTKLYNIPTSFETWPLLEDVFTFSDIINVTQLDNMALARVNAISLPPTHLSIIVASFTTPTYGDTYKIGDTVNIRIVDDRFPGVKDPGTGYLIPDSGYLDAIYRIVSINVSPGENGPDRITIGLTLPVGTGGVVI